MKQTAHQVGRSKKHVLRLRMFLPATKAKQQNLGMIYAVLCVLCTHMSHKKYVNIPSEKYIYVHKYVYICVNTYLCKMDENRSYAGLSKKWMSTGLMLACHKNG